jgi:hypothetical protein
MMPTIPILAGVESHSQSKAASYSVIRAERSVSPERCNNDIHFF